MVRLRVRLATPDNFWRFSLPGVIAAACLVSTAIACSEKKIPGAPTQNPPANTPTAPTVTELKVRGCEEAGGYQCRAFVAYSDGKEEEVSAQTRWQQLATSEERLTATFDTSTGQVTPKFAGTITVVGQYYTPGVANLTGRQTVDLMLPPVPLKGTVLDGYSKRDVVGARLVVTAGPSAGTAATTDNIGRWVLTVVPTTKIDLEVSHPDYRTGKFDGLWLTSSPLSQPRNLSLYPLRSEPSPTPTPPPAPTPPPPPSAPALVTQDFFGDIEDAYPTTAGLCPDPRYYRQSVRCRTFTLPPSPHRQVGAELVWRNWAGGIDSEIELGVQVVQGNSVVAHSSNNVGAGTASIPLRQVEANKAIEVQVLLLEGRGPAKFSLRTTRYSIY
jgi:hypothetical protein